MEKNRRNGGENRLSATKTTAGPAERNGEFVHEVTGLMKNTTALRFRQPGLSTSIQSNIRRRSPRSYKPSFPMIGKTPAAQTNPNTIDARHRGTPLFNAPHSFYAGRLAVFACKRVRPGESPLRMDRGDFTSLRPRRKPLIVCCESKIRPPPIERDRTVARPEAHNRYRAREPPIGRHNNRDSRRRPN